MSLLEDKDTAAKMEKDEITSTVSSDRNEQRRTIEKKSTSLFNQKLALKIDLHVLLPMIFLNFLSLMGRTNIGAALIQELPEDLELNAIRVFCATTIAMAPLILLEIPSNLLMRYLEKSRGLSYMRYLSIITILLGVVTLGQGFDKSYAAILATRFFVGVFDAGLIPGCVFICSLYYPSVHLQWRMSMLMVANIASNIVSNILAFAIAHIHSTNGYHGWRWIFIVEGCLTIGIGAICCVSNLSRPETSKFLSAEEKDIISSTVEARTTTIGIAAELKLFFSNILNYIWASCYVMTCATTYSVAIFGPSFVTAFHPHYTVPQVQSQVVPIFVVSAAACLLAAWLADRLNHRAGFAIGGYIVTAIGFIILRQEHIAKPSIAMLGLYFVSIGTFTSLPLLWSLTLNNLSSPFQRAFGCGFVVGIGNVGGFVSSWIFRKSQAPHYHDGMTDSLIMTLVSAALIAIAWVYIALSSSKTSTTAEIDGRDGKVATYHA